MTLANLSLTQLRKHAQAIGIKGMSKADRPTVVAAINRATRCAPKRMSAEHRLTNYALQRGFSTDTHDDVYDCPVTPRQARRINKATNKAKKCGN